MTTTTPPRWTTMMLVLLIGTGCTTALLATPSVAWAQQGAADDADDEDDDEDETDDEHEDDAETAADETSSLQQGGRVEFDARVVRGEGAGSGAVYLFERPPRPLPSMIDRRSSYLDGTVQGALGDDGVERLDESRNED